MLLLEVTRSNQIFDCPQSDNFYKLFKNVGVLIKTLADKFEVKIGGFFSAIISRETLVIAICKKNCSKV